RYSGCQNKEKFYYVSNSPENISTVYEVSINEKINRECFSRKGYLKLFESSGNTILYAFTDNTRETSLGKKIWTGYKFFSFNEELKRHSQNSTKEFSEVYAFSKKNIEIMAVVKYNNNYSLIKINKYGVVENTYDFGVKPIVCQISDDWKYVVFIYQDTSTFLTKLKMLNITDFKLLDIPESTSVSAVSGFFDKNSNLNFVVSSRKRKCDILYQYSTKNNQSTEIITSEIFD
ncbi:MAG TPA: hypothetical protein VKS21_10970, partial [Spirochaetota bacterium]|nr:hypothetical protein [Spirochaetota bacterium]